LVTQIVEKLRRRVIKNFMDIIVLAELKSSQMSGYDVMRFVHNRHDILVSSGTIYSLLYSMERDGLVKGVQKERKRVYTLTEKGEQSITVITKANKEMQTFLRNILLLS
jgi:DNA-binding PadR family transcriptional regulator